MNTGDRIEVRRIRVDGRHGALDGEKDSLQPFEVDLDIYLDLEAAGSADDLLATVDYGSVTLEVVEIVSSTSFSLLEALAQAIADAILTDLRIDRVDVSLRKMRPPIDAHLDSVGVRLVRTNRH